MILVEDALDRRGPDHAVHPIHPGGASASNRPGCNPTLAPPRVVWLHKALLRLAGHATHVGAHRLDMDDIAVPRLLGELGAVLCETGVDLTGHRPGHVLRASMQPRARQMSDGRLQGTAAIIHRQQRLPPECDGGRLLRLGRDRRSRFARRGFEILDRPSLAPLCHRLMVDPRPPARRCQQDLRSFGPTLGPTAGQPSSSPLGWRAPAMVTRTGGVCGARSWRLRHGPGP